MKPQGTPRPQAFPLSELETLALSGRDLPGAAPSDRWLVLEPGTCQVTSPLEQTIPPDDGAEEELTFERPEPMVFALDAGDGPQFLRVGRAPYCDLVIDDATVSREHLALTRDMDAVWRVEPLTEAFSYCRQRLGAGDARAIVSGDRIILGEVEVTFYSSMGLAERFGKRAT